MFRFCEFTVLVAAVARALAGPLASGVILASWRCAYGDWARVCVWSETLTCVYAIWRFFVSEMAWRLIWVIARSSS